MSASDIYAEFCQIYAPDKIWKHYEKIAITGEHQVKYTGQCNTNAAAFTVDGGLIPAHIQNRKCDKVVLIERPDTSCHACFVELKSGTDLKRAITQLAATLNEALFDKHKFHTRECVVVCGASIPRNKPNGEWDKMQLRFMKKTKCHIRKLRNGGIDKKKI